MSDTHLGYPHTLPRIGEGLPSKITLCLQWSSCDFACNGLPPTSVGFSAQAANGTARGAYRARQKPPSVAIAPHGFTHGRVRPC